MHRTFLTSIIALFFFTLHSSPAHAQQLYWTDFANNRIQKSNLDGSNVQTVLTNLPGATALAIDNTAGQMYWSETGANARIRRANLNGTNIQTILAAQDVVDIALDPESNLLVYAQYGASQPNPAVRAATLTGGSPHNVITGNDVVPQAIALFDGQVYYPANGASAIRRVNYDGTSDQEFVATAGGGTFALLFPPPASSNRLYWLDEDDDYIRGSDDDFNFFSVRVGNPNPNGDTFPYGFAADENRFYWSDAINNKIQSIDHFGDDYQSLVAVDGSPRRLAIAVPEPAAATLLLALPWLFTRSRTLVRQIAYTA